MINIAFSRRIRRAERMIIFFTLHFSIRKDFAIAFARIIKLKCARKNPLRSRVLTTYNPK